MTTYIISFGGLIPSYYKGNDVLTCDSSEAYKFTSIEDAWECIMECFPSYTNPASIKVAITLEWIATPKW
jgi:hypothetical protein